MNVMPKIILPTEADGQNADIAEVAFNKEGLVPVVAQCADTGEVLMLAWMNKEALTRTLDTGRVTYYSRSRKSLWEKGETSGNRQTLVAAYLDCDGDAIVVKVKQKGVACHKGDRVCFTRPLTSKGVVAVAE